MKMKYLIWILFMLFSAQCFSQEVLTIGEVFDFDVGDEFHYQSNLPDPPRGERYKVLEKRYSRNYDTVIYKIYQNRYTSEAEYEPEPHLVYSFYSKTYSKSYTALDSSIYHLNPWLQYDSIAKYNEVFYYDSVVGTSSKLCNLSICGSDISVGDFEPTEMIEIYGQGVGLVRSYYREGASGGIVDEDNSLIYYKKNDKTCGTPDLTGINENIISSTDFLIFPNPTSSKFTIQLTDNFASTWNMELYNIQGKLLDFKILEGGSYQYDASQMDVGVYILKISSLNKVLTEKIIIN